MGGREKNDETKTVKFLITLKGQTKINKKMLCFYKAKHVACNVGSYIEMF